MRKRFRWSPEQHKLVPISEGPVSLGIMLMPDLPAYVSPVTGKVVSGRRARREDLARTHSRPYEGREQEVKEAARQRAYAEQRLDARLERGTAEVFSHMPERVRRPLLGR